VVPGIAADLAPRGPFDGIPAYWQSAARYLDAHPGGRTLLVPGSSFADYVWGHTNDEPLFALAASPSAVRGAVPLGAPGATRLLDGVGEDLAAGLPSAGLAEALARAGVGRVLLRNDIDPRANADPLLAAHATLASSPGLHRATGFGPLAAMGLGPGGIGPAPRRQALERWVVDSFTRAVTTYDAAALRTLHGGPEAAVALAAAGEGAAPMVAAFDGGAASPSTVTDSMRRRSLDFGSTPGRSYSATMTAGDDVTGGRREGDLLPVDVSHQTTVRFDDGAQLSASSSAADPSKGGWIGPGTRPAAAFDGDPATAWVSSAAVGAAWLQVSWPTARTIGSLRLLPDSRHRGYPVTSVRAVTDHGVAQGRRLADGSVVVAPSSDPTTTLRLDFGRRSGAVAVAEVEGLPVTEHVVLPADAVDSDPGTVWVLRHTPQRRACIDTGRGWACSPRLARPGEDPATWRRTLGTDSARSVPVSAWVRARPGAALDAALDSALGYTATSTSVMVDDPAARPGAAFDGDPGTAWVTRSGDATPALRLALDREVTLQGVGVRLDADDLARVRSITVAAGTDRRSVEPTTDDPVLIAPLRGRDFTVTFRLRPESAGIPLRVEQIKLLGLPAPAADARVLIPCAAGPQVKAAQGAVAFSVTSSVRSLLDGESVPATPCAGATLHLPSGESDVVAEAAPATTFDLLRLGDAGAASSGTPGPARPVAVREDGAEQRTYAVEGGGQALLALTEGANRGWHATAYGQDLEPVTLDGWRQAWVLPAGALVEVHVDFRPGGWHRVGLAVGGLALVALCLLAAIPGRTRRSLAPCPPASGSRAEASVAGLGAPLLFAGPWGLAVGVVAGLVARVRPSLVPITAAGLLAGSGVLVAASGTPAGGAAASLLAVGSVSLLAWQALGLVRDGRGRRERRDDAAGAAEAPQQRPFEPVPRARGDEERGGDRHEQHAHEAP
jgi:arabinofuranan 3-O-arabinosyltransferase